MCLTYPVGRESWVAREKELLAEESFAGVGRNGNGNGDLLDFSSWAVRDWGSGARTAWVNAVVDVLIAIDWRIVVERGRQRNTRDWWKRTGSDWGLVQTCELLSWATSRNRNERRNEDFFRLWLGHFFRHSAGTSPSSPEPDWIKFGIGLNYDTIGWWIVEVVCERTDVTQSRVVCVSLSVYKVRQERRVGGKGTKKKKKADLLLERKRKGRELESGQERESVEVTRNRLRGREKLVRKRHGQVEKAWTHESHKEKRGEKRVKMI